MRVSIRPALLAMALVIPFGLVCGGVPGDLLEDPSSEIAAVKTIASFEDRNPFSGGVVVAARAPEGARRCGSTGLT